jgi:hypothetical protein
MSPVFWLSFVALLGGGASLLLWRMLRTRTNPHAAEQDTSSSPVVPADQKDERGAHTLDAETAWPLVIAPVGCPEDDATGAEGNIPVLDQSREAVAESNGQPGVVEISLADASLPASLRAPITSGLALEDGHPADSPTPAMASALSDTHLQEEDPRTDAAQELGGLCEARIVLKEPSPEPPERMEAEPPPCDQPALDAPQPVQEEPDPLQDAAQGNEQRAPPAAREEAAGLDAESLWLTPPISTTEEREGPEPPAARPSDVLDEQGERLPIQGEQEPLGEPADEDGPCPPPVAEDLTADGAKVPESAGQERDPVAAILLDVAEPPHSDEDDAPIQVPSPPAAEEAADTTRTQDDDAGHENSPADSAAEHPASLDEPMRGTSAPSLPPISTPNPQVDKPTKPKPPRAPRRYQPQQRGVPAPRRQRNGVAATAARGERACPIEVRLRSQVGGSIVLSLLPRRRDGLPAAVQVAGAGPSPLQLSALREDWYQEVLLPAIGSVLQQGVEWYADAKDGPLRWSLSGRDLYVLGTSGDWGGYVSTPRLALGDQHAVLCTKTLLPQVEDLLRQCCGTLPARFSEEDGLPEGWFGFRPVTPTLPLLLGSEPNILDALRPSPDVQIALRGGIRLQYVQWLAGYPPVIRLYGDLQHADPPIIDGVAAMPLSDGSFIVPGWDSVGDHWISCAGQTKSYAIVEPEDGWEVWPAYSFSAGRGQKLPAICGALAAAAATDNSLGWPVVLAPAGNPLLLGAEPGQIYRCASRQDVRMPFSVAAIPFEPVWALPSDPIHADKVTARVLLVGTAQPPRMRGDRRRIPSATHLLQWCSTILDCSRKGLSVEPGGGQAAAAWRAFRDLARSIWRASR